MKNHLYHCPRKIYGVLDLVWSACKSLKYIQQEVCSSYSPTDFSEFLRIDGSIVGGACKINDEALQARGSSDCICITMKC